MKEVKQLKTVAEALDVIKQLQTICIEQREEIKGLKAFKAKFYHHNRDIFLKYFESVQQYQVLIDTGNFEKLERIIKEQSNFNNK